MKSDTDDVEALLRAQWAALRSWLDDVEVRSFGDLTSVLPGWTVRELVAHLGYGVEMLTAVRPAGPDERPLTIGEYVAQYRPAASHIEQSTRRVAAAMPDVLVGIDAMADAAWSALDSLHASVVSARRGPLTKRDYLVTRLFELVVHADDLHRSLPCGVASAVLDEPQAVVSQALAEAYQAAAGTSADTGDAVGWIRLATGRAVSDDPRLPLL